jgi:hypothetical protein
MKIIHLFLAITSVLSSPVGDWAGKLVPNQYIIVFKPNALVSESMFSCSSSTPDELFLDLIFTIFN